MKKSILLLAAVITGNQMYAQTDTIKNLQDVVVTANKFPQKQIETGKVLTVITQQQLQQSAAKTIGEVLNQQVGITVSGANNTLGTNQAIYIRGANSGNTLILVDGIPMNDPSGISMEFDLNTFSINQIERIEVLKGAQSTLYGSDAVAGVINIITKKSFDKPSNVNITLSAGSYDTYWASVNISGNDDGLLNYFIGYSKVYSRGFSSAYDSTGKMGFDRDGFNQDVVQGSLGFPLTTKLSARVYGKYSYHRADIDAGAFADDKDYRYQNINANTGLALQYVLKNATLHFNYNYNWYNRTFLDDSTDIGGYYKYQKGDYTGLSSFAELYSSFQICKQLELLSGIDFRRNATDQTYIAIPDYGYPVTPMSSDSVKSNQYSVYASLIFKSGKGLNAELGGRWNNHSIYGNNFTYSFNPSYTINKSVKLFINISSAYRVPSLYQLFSEFGNKNLKPEQSVSYEAGIQYSKNNFSTRAVGFKRNTKDVIIFYTDANWNSFYKNEDKQKAYGIELEASIKVFRKKDYSKLYFRRWKN
jgi:vitamin B12 transporter